MKKTVILLSLFTLIILSGCVSKSKYNNALSELQRVKNSQALLEQENERLVSEIENLQYKNDYMNTVVEGYEERIQTLEQYINSSKKIQNKTISELTATRQSLKDKLKIKDLELESLREQNDTLKNSLEPFLKGN